MDKASEAILSLKPIMFRYKEEIDADRTPQFGLVAEDVKKEAVNAMLLNEFLKEHRTVEELKSEIAVLAATVKEQAAQIQKVSAQLELSKPAPQTVNNNQ
jgi:uncharacterized small protein (DUF1192 family)